MFTLLDVAMPEPKSTPGTVIAVIVIAAIVVVLIGYIIHTIRKSSGTDIEEPVAEEKAAPKAPEVEAAEEVKEEKEEKTE